MRPGLRGWLMAAALLLPLVVRAALPLPAALQGTGLQVRGAGEMRFLGFEIYQAALWQQGEGAPSNNAFALVIRYSRDFSGERLVSTSESELMRLGLADEATLQRWRPHMRAAFPDVKAGERITGHFVPGRGARFYHDERLTAEVQDPAFAEAFFAIWLDPRTREPALRSQLLGERGDG